MDMEKKVVEIFSEQDCIKFAYLFGSVAERKEGKLSDVDMAVFLDESLNKKEKLNLHLRLISDLESVLNTDKIDLIVMNDASISLNYEVIKANYPLFIRDMGEKIDFEHRVLSRYLDRRYYEMRWTDEFLSKVAEKGIWQVQV